MTTSFPSKIVINPITFFRRRYPFSFHNCSNTTVPFCPINNHIIRQSYPLPSSISLPPFHRHPIHFLSFFSNDFNNTFFTNTFFYHFSFVLFSLGFCFPSFSPTFLLLCSIFRILFFTFFRFLRRRSEFFVPKNIEQRKTQKSSAKMELDSRLDEKIRTLYRKSTNPNTVKT